MAITTLTYGLIQTRLQIANCCAATMGVDVIKQEKKGIKCKDPWSTIDTILSMVDALCNYATIIPSVDAIFITTLPDSFTTIQLIFTGITVTKNFDTSTANTLAEIVVTINTTSAYTAVTDGSTLLVTAPQGTGAAGNALPWTRGLTIGIISNVGHGFFTGGVTGNYNTTFDDTHTCLTTTQIENILEKLSTYGCPCGND